MGTKDTSTSTLPLGLTKSSDSTCMYLCLLKSNGSTASTILGEVGLFKPHRQEMLHILVTGFGALIFLGLKKYDAVIPVVLVGFGYVASLRRVMRSPKGTLTMIWHNCAFASPSHGKNKVVLTGIMRHGWVGLGGVVPEASCLGFQEQGKIPQIVMHHDTFPFFNADVLRLCHGAVQRSCLPM